MPSSTPTAQQDSERVHRYTCTIHDGDGCDGHCHPDVATLISWYADDLAFVTEETPAATAEAFISQLGTAGSRLEDAGINGAEDLETAATYLNDAASLTGDAQAVLIDRARKLLNFVTDMVDEYRDMV
ncbi:hypothetical protein ABZ915_17620 [Streptomyces sp. NPDC046915]|uniref:hypothetical protein n=1 Tax=Streptomyces sp. NPDC046915 TaxID=3155257 RepID=UPI0033DFB229